MLVDMATDTWESYQRSWQRSLRASNRSPRTIETYTLATAQLGDWLVEHNHPTDPAEVKRGHIEGFIGHVLDTRSSATARQRYQSLRSFFGWMEEEDEVPNPMTKMRPPRVEERPPPVLTKDEVDRVLSTPASKSFIDRRDAALLYLLADTGVRASELVGLSLDDVNFDMDVIQVKGKGGEYRAAPFGHTTSQAVDRYLRVRARHPQAIRTEALFIGERGPITRSGLGQIVKRRGVEAGIDNLYPHLFRHTFVHRWLADGGQEGDVARILGWSRKSSAQMLDRYGASAATERAHEAHKNFGPVDHL
jgi:site-specific recombinase XerD